MGSPRTVLGESRGYAMAVLLVGMAVTAVLMGLAMPMWRNVVQREREEELIFRGEQYVRAIRLFQRKFANAFPPSVELLVDQKFLRKKYKDPVNKEGEFQLLYQGQMGQPAAGRGGQQRPGAVETVEQAGVGAGGRGRPTPQTSTSPASGVQGVGPRGGLVGVVSKSQ